MSNLSVTTKIFQALGNNKDSLVPTLVKDTACNGAITYIYDKNASKADGRERAIEEFGTEVIWIAGIPAVKWLLDKTLYKIKKADPNFDVRNLKKAGDSFDRLSYLAENAKDETQKKFLNTLKNSEGLQKTYKKLHFTKFGIATAIPLALLSGLIIFKQQTTNKNLEKKIREANNAKKNNPLNSAVENELKKTEAFAAFAGNKQKENKEISFGNKLVQAASQFMYNPLKNQSILDAGITTTRLAQGRKGEKGEILFKELFTIGMYYFFAAPIQKGIEAISNKVFKKPISTEFELLSNKNLSKLLKEEGLKESIETLTNLNDEKQILDYVYKNDNALTKMLKISGDIPTIKGTDGVIDSFKFLDTADVKKSAKNIQELMEQTLKQADAKKFLSKVKVAKGASILANIAIGILAVGVLQPAITIAMRKKQNNGETVNPAISKIENEMQQKFS